MKDELSVVAVVVIVIVVAHAVVVVVFIVQLFLFSCCICCQSYLNCCISAGAQIRQFCLDLPDTQQSQRE